MKIGPLFAAVVLAGAAAGTAYWIKNSNAPQTAQKSGGGGRRAQQQTGAAPVAVAQVTKQTVPVYRDGIGNVQALNAVTVRAQVDGRLIAVEFQEGQTVKKGDVLARIDPVTFKALYDQAVAKKAQDEANLANLKLDLERYRQLAKTNAGPKQQADQQAAAVAQMEAQIEADQGAIDNAKATLDYTTIVSPLNGRVGLRQVDPGNIVHASDTNGIVLIMQMQPIGVLFTLPQRDLDATKTALGKGTVKVEIPNADGRTVDATGTLASIDNQIDVTTGTIKLKAEFPNTDFKLWPGQFVSVRVVIDTLVDAKVVPAPAVRRGIDGNFVYLLNADNTVKVNKVVVQQQDEAIAVIKEGLDFGQTVVTEGFSALKEGKDVVVGGSLTDPAAKPVRPSGEAAKPDGKSDGKEGRAKGEGKRGDGKGSGRRNREGTSTAPEGAPGTGSGAPAPTTTPSGTSGSAEKEKGPPANGPSNGQRTEAEAVPSAGTTTAAGAGDAKP